MSALDTTSATGSFWLDSTSDLAARRELRTITQADVCVLGGGVTGVTAALLLARGGARVVLVEAARIGSGVTGTTTGKITALHGMAYAELARKAGADRAAAYAQANAHGVEVMRELVTEEGIDCDWRDRAAMTYTADPGRLGDLESEYHAARDAGLDVELVDAVPGPIEAAGAIRAPGGAEMHPVRYVRALAELAERAGAVIYEGTRAVSVGDGSPCVVRTDTGGEVRADAVLVATHYPILDRGLYFTRMTAMRSYAIGIEAGPGEEQEAMLYGIDSPTRSLRSTPAGDGELVILGGEGHPTGREDDTAAHFRNLESTAASWYPGCPITHRWSAQDPVTADGLPYAGRLWPGSSRLYVATGFRKWGFTNGTAAALLVADALLGRGPRDWAGALSPQRVAVRAGVPKMVTENAKVGWRFAADRFRSDHGVDAADDLAPGEGAVLGPVHRRRAAYRDESGRLHVRSALCTHLGCEVRWNSAERSFDCPCHGSRFAPLDGAVLEGPAVSPLSE